MKYFYYNRDTGQITEISPSLNPTAADPYIEIDDELANQFLSGSKHTHQYLVTYRGELRAKFETSTQLNHVTAQDRIYAVPRSTAAGDFAIKQNVSAKTVEIKLNADAGSWWQNNRYFGQTHYFIVACCPMDPHLVHWTWNFEVEQLARGPLKQLYQGADDLQFYTRKIFESYSHEQSN